MPARKDIAGQRFGRLTAVEYSHSVSRKSLWACECECGNRKAIWLQSLTNGDAVSCGCKRAEAKDPKARIVESSEIDELSGCWNWSLRLDRGGYGRMKIQLGARDSYRFDGAHRYSYSIFKGDIPKGMEVCHSCDNPACVNPEHLWLGTHQQNMQDMHSKGRGAKGYKRSKTFAAISSPENP